jgi:hypothetical protein
MERETRADCAKLLVAQTELLIVGLQQLVVELAQNDCRIEDAQKLLNFLENNLAGLRKTVFRLQTKH